MERLRSGWMMRREEGEVTQLVIRLLFGIIWFVAGIAAPGLAAQNVGNASQKGSLLIFPRIDTTSGRDTIIRISNDYPRDARIRCSWVDAEQTVDEFELHITSAQPIWFRASDGTGAGTYDGARAGNYPVRAAPFLENRVGELKCWAVNAAGTTQIAWNHLYGTAMIIDYIANTAYEYNSINFTVRPSGYSLGDEVSPAGDLILSGKAREYDACPKYLLYNFFPHDDVRSIGLDGEASGVIVGRSSLTLVPCDQDLRQDRSPTCTRAKFDVWNENEVKFTGAYQCIKCWFEGYLQDLGTPQGPRGGKGGRNFTWNGLHTTLGRVRVQGAASTGCRGVFKTGQVDPCWTDPSDTNYQGQVATPLLGLMVTEVHFDGKKGLLVTTGIGAGTAVRADILWDSGQLPEEGSGR